jgi:hypothetical protein
MANEVYKQAIVLVAADSHPDSLTAFQNDSGPVVCNFHMFSLATDPSPGYLCSRRARSLSWHVRAPLDARPFPGPVAEVSR